jgi:DNA repair protein SbcD/Mre11
MFKFLHAADIHLDSPLKGLERYEGAPVDEIRCATRRALENLVRLAIERQVAFVLMAGDVYDGDWRDFDTPKFFDRQMNALRDAGIPVYLISGNHDAANRMTKSLRSLEEKTVHRFPTGRPATKHLEDYGVSIHGQSFATAAVTDNLATGYPAAVKGNFNIGLLHTCATGDCGHERYAPCSLDDLRLKEYDYWALGHVHQRRELLADEDTQVHFSGNVQGRHIKEAGPKGCLLVTVDDRQRAVAQFEPLDVLRWESWIIDASACQDDYEVLVQASQGLSALLADCDGRALAVRVEVRGRTAAHDKLIVQRRQWTEELRSLTQDKSAGNVWIEKVCFQTSPPRDLDESAWADGPLGEVRRYIQELQTDKEAIGRLGGELADLRRKLPAELKEADDLAALENPDYLARLLDDVGPLLVSRLIDGGGVEKGGA